ncbi:C97 family peptidase [Candidatus Bathyarchaeota archaeon]|nr:C97 family peptidase [Candidatus Bathyarchaeota archaeon]
MLTFATKQPGRVSSALWFVGSSLLHTGVVINGQEYAYGGHGRPDLSGVYWTKPGQVPPGALFKCEIVHGFTFATEPEIEATIRDASADFLGPAYNILTLNCNHFTSHLVERLTGMAGPGWLNRAARIGVAVPCMVPREWVQPPAADTADGELVEGEEEEDEDDDGGESSHMLPTKPQQNSVR